MKSRKKNGPGLRFPCECVSVQRGYSDPWAGITQRRLLNDGTKERILNETARQPSTITGLARELGLSQPSIHAHVNEMLQSELLREAREWEKRHPAENYYEPNFPVIKAVDRPAFDRVCQALAADIADLFERAADQLRQTLQANTLAGGQWQFVDVAQFCFASAQRGARTMLEQRGVLPPRKRHRNGAEWIFWAEEPPSSNR